MTPASSLDHIARKTALTAPFRETVKRLKQGEQEVLLHGLPATLAAFLATHLQRSTNRPLLVITSDEDRAESWRDDLQAIAGEGVVRYFPAWDVGLYDGRSPSEEVTRLRVEAMAQLAAREPTITVAPAAALVTPVIPPHALEHGILSLRAGEERAPESLSAHLVDAGFERVPMIDGVGQFSIRGGIVDVFPFALEQPLRLEFFGDEIESIRQFDVATQRSLSGMEEASVLPAAELLLHPPLFEDYADAIEKAERDHEVDLDDLKDRLELGGSLEGIEAFMSLLYGRDNGLFEYLHDPILFCDETEEFEPEIARALRTSVADYEKRRDRGDRLPPEALARDAGWLRRQVSAESRLTQAPVGSAGSSVRFESREPRLVQGELTVLRKELETLESEGYEIHLLTETQGQSSRLEEILDDGSDKLSFGLGTLNRGFVFPEARIAVLNDHEIFSRRKQRYRYRRFKAARPISSRDALSVGDFVVHVDHGVGRYRGIRRLTLSGRDHDCLEVIYQGEDKLFVPVEQLDRLRKYSGAEGEPPLLNKLGGNAWEKLKERTREEIFKMARELIHLYAERQTRPGFGYAADSALQQELEASFPYQETPDQLRAVEEVKRDMEASHPMDRLVCGDVGYGKTEVAVRAAYKAVCDGKQVAVLVPTTILAQQHFLTFSERMSHTPARIEVMSRFRTAKELNRTARDLKDGKVDILIGTHRILSKDVEFRDLGLLVVDEEQRFGVRHKEKLKQIRRLIDVVTLTATPIPRTLHMSLMGSRDMSVINTPPQDRLPIHTEILSFDEDRIAEAITQEVTRGGQVYFVHNRVQSIQRLAEYLEELLPAVRFGVAHGQMGSRQLEKIMFDFLQRKYDCLVTTMIIESGIDIPTVNTVLVNRADMLGLGQLYQIRGRVGRSKERAYAYLLVPKGKRLTRKSRLRLRAIEEFADLGSGFNIAMRDMEIRGAGNLLGAQQHGFIHAVGFDLYCRLLDEAVRELKGEVVEPEVEPDIRIAATAYIPEDYISDSDLKIDFYQRLADARRVVDLLAIREELEDRFGRLPWQARSLMNIMEIKVLARQLRLSAVQLERSRFRLVFPEEVQITPADIQRLVEKSSSELEFDVAERLTIETFLRARDEQERLEKAKLVMQELV